MEQFAAAVTFWPILVTKVTDFIRNLVDRGGTAPKWVWNVVPFGLGAVIAVTLEINYVGLLPLPDQARSLTGVPAEILTGFGIGAVGSFWHELMDWLSSKAKTYTASQG